MSDHLAFAPEILRRLGEELVPHPDQGIVELARNSYDADATECTVTLVNVESLGGTVVVSDNGDGMNRSAIADGWLVLGRSSKKRDKRTRLDRVPAGDKGLGRLAALRLGNVATLATRPRDEPGVEYLLEIDWVDFENANLVEDVALQIKKRSARERVGTTIELHDLRVKLRPTDIQRLTRALILLSDPFESSGGFKPVLNAPEFVEMEKRVAGAYFDEVDYRIHATLDADGMAEAQLLDWRGNPVHIAKHVDIASRAKRSGPYETPAADFDLWVFSLSAEAFSNRSAGVTEVRDWLRVVGGVHVYQNELRVPPYGDSGADWLEMNLRRVRSPEARPSTNNSLGKVTVHDSGERLVQKTDRSGFVENEAFAELRMFAMDVLDWSASQRLKEAEKRRSAQRRQAEKARQSTEADEATISKTLESSASPGATAAFARYRKAIDRQMSALREDLLLYRTLGTVGTTTSAFAHESIKPAGRIEQAAKLVRTRGTKAFGDAFEDAVGKQLDSLMRSARSLSQWARMPLHLLNRDSRRPRRFDLADVIADVSDVLDPFLGEAGITLEFKRPSVAFPAYGPPAAAEAILMNLVINSINAMLDGVSQGKQRIILVECILAEDGFASLTVADSGPGIIDIDVDEMWLPGRTTRDGGTGLGLTIVRDSVADLGGEVAAVANGPLGGAEFTVRVPVLAES
jgi:signal transduction histidine kinase